MTFEQIQKANSTLAAIDIKGKSYVQVNDRIKAFRMLYPDGFIHTAIISNENGVVLMQAAVGTFDEAGEERILGTGHAYEVEQASTINKTSYIENCETSAVGRALAMCGIGIDTSVASFEEVDMAVKKQEKGITSDKPIDDIKRQVLEGMCKQLGLDYKATFPNGVTEGQFKTAADKLKGLIDKKEKKAKA